MYLIECEDKTKELFRVWCTELNAYVLEGVDREGIRKRLRESAKRNADQWTEDLVGDALKAGEVPRRAGGAIH